MRKYLWVAASATLAVLVYAQLSAGQVLANYAKTLFEAKSLKVSYAVVNPDGGSQNFQLEMAKPNLVRIDTPSELIVADGSTLVRYDKAQKTFTRDPQDAGTLRGILSADEFAVWDAFFNGSAFGKASAKSLGTVNRRGMALSAIEASFDEGKKKITYYIAQQDSLARQAEIGYSDTPGKAIVNTKSIEIGGDAKAELFAFKAPDGSRELTQEERLSAEWYTDLEKAKEVAAKTKRLIFIDFYADW